MVAAILTAQNALQLDEEDLRRMSYLDAIGIWARDERIRDE